MSTEPKQVTKLLAAARNAARAPIVDASLRERLAVSALEVALADEWDSLERALRPCSAAVQEHVRDALEYAVAHPVLVSKAGKAYNGRLFVLPVSQALHGTTALGYLPQGETIQKLLTSAFCPNGVGILLNRLLAEATVQQLTLKDIWTLSSMAFDRFSLGSADAPESPFIELSAGESSGLHFVVFLAFAQGLASDELLSLDGDELAVRSLTVMDAINPLITQACCDAGHPDVYACIHLPQSFFYEPLEVDAAHESFLFALNLNAWVAEAEGEGRTLELQVQVERTADQQAVVVTANADRRPFGRYTFAVDIGDTEMVEDVCANVVELARQHGLRVELPPSVKPLPAEIYAQNSKSLALVSGPTTLQ